MPEYPIHGSPYFDCREFVDARTWSILGPKCAFLIDPKVVRVSDLIRELAGAAVKINNWHYRKRGQQLYDSSGFRAIWDNTGGSLSQHRCGRAADYKVTGFSPSLLLILIQRNKERFLEAGLTTIENLDATPTWLHGDVRPRLEGVHPEGDFWFVDP